MDTENMVESEATHQRRQGIRVRRFHHHAFRTEDMEVTRKFWEDFLGMPLIGTFVETVDPVTEGPSNYIHTFFEMADGSALAFFQFEQGMYKTSDITGNQDPFDHHIALEVDTKEDVLAFRDRAEAHGVEYMLIDHGYCYSIYMHDPNGMQVELTSKVPQTVEIMERHAKTAHEDLRRWLAGLKKGNNSYRTFRGDAD
ncbi:MAG: VOC family protein [Myxococcota bacterium]